MTLTLLVPISTSTIIVAPLISTRVPKQRRFLEALGKEFAAGDAAAGPDDFVGVDAHLDLVLGRSFGDSMVSAWF